MTTPNASKKQAVIARLYADCQAAGNLTFDNDAVRRVAAAVDFKNPFDATKIDHSALLPAALVDDDAFIVHLGQGSIDSFTASAPVIIGLSQYRQNGAIDGPTAAAS